MPGPWDKYQSAAPAADGPWAKYQPAPAAPAAPVDQPVQLPTEPPVVPGAGTPTGYKPPSLGQDIVTGLERGVQGTGRGIADLAGAPVDLATLAINLASAAGEKGLQGARYVGNKLTGGALGDGPITLPRIEKPFLGSNDIADASSEIATAAGFPVADPEQMSMADRMAYKANEFATSGGLGGMAAREVALARNAIPNRAPKLGDAFVAPYEKGDISPVVGDAAAGAGSGSAIGAYEAAVPPEKRSPLAEFVASLIGGVGGGAAKTLATTPAKVAKTVRDASVESRLPYLEDGAGGKIPVTKGAADKAAEYAQRNADNPRQAADTIQTKAREYRDAGLPVPTTGTMSGDVGLGAIEQGDRVRNPVPYQRKDQATRTAAAEQLQSVAPADAEPRAATEFAGKDAKTRSAAAAVQVAQAEKADQAAQAAEQATAAPFREGANPQAASRALDKVVVEDTMQPRAAEKNAKFAAIPDAERDVTPMLAAAAKVRDTLGSLNNPSAIIPEATLRRIEALAPQTVEKPGEPATFKVDQMGVSEKVSGGPTVETTGGKVSFQDLNKLRPELSDAVIAARKAGNFTLADNLKALKREINTEAERMAAEGNPEAAGALDYFKNEFAPYFGDGAGGQLRKDINADTPNRAATPPSGTAERFLFTGSGSKEAAADLRKILEIAPDPAAGQKAARNYILSDLAKTVDKNGTIDPRRLKDWMGKRSEMLSEFPSVEAEMQKLLQDVVNGRSKSNTSAVELKKALSSAKLTEQDIANGNLSLLLDSSPEVAVAKVFGASDPEKAMAGIVQGLGKDAAARDGWKKAVSDYLSKRVTGTNTQLTDTGDPAVQYAAMAKMLRDHKNTLAKVYTPDEMNALQKAQKLLEPFGALSRRATVGSPTAENNAVAWRTLEAGMKAYFGVLKGGGIMRSIKLAASTIPNHDAEVMALVHKMQFDPEVAVHLLNRPLSEVGTPAWNGKLNRLLGIAAASREER